MGTYVSPAAYAPSQDSRARAAAAGMQPAFNTLPLNCFAASMLVRVFDWLNSPAPAAVPLVPPPLAAGAPGGVPLPLPPAAVPVAAGEWLEWPWPRWPK